MQPKLVGYEFAPKQQFQQELASYTQGLAAGNAGDQPPLPARPVYADDKGNHFMAMPTEDGVATVPFVPGSPPKGDRGGFKPIEEMPQSSPGDGTAEMLGGMIQSVPPEQTAAWLGGAAMNAMFAGAQNSPQSQALAALGIANPAANGMLGNALATAAGAAGLGPVGGLLGGAMMGGQEGLANAMGTMGIHNLMQASGLSGIPGAGAVASMLGDQLGSGLNDLFSDGLQQTADSISDALSADGCFGLDASALPDLDAITPQALDAAADQLLSQWQVDDESSAAEHIAHKAVMDNQAAIKNAISNPQAVPGKIKALKDKISGMFSGKSSSAKLPAARISDPDVTKPEILSTGEGNILAEGLPISRVSDKLAPSQAPVANGAAMVLSTGLPTARVSAPTTAPGVMMENGAASVLVGDLGTGDAAAAAPNSDTSGNGGPAGPDAPASVSSGSSGEGSSGDGDTSTGASDDRITGELSDDSFAAPAQDSDSDGGAEDTAAKPLTDQEKFDQWYDKEKKEGLGWTDGLPACPEKLDCETKTHTNHKEGISYDTFECKNPDSEVWRDPSEPWGDYHPEAEREIRTQTPAGQHGNQCTYDKSGNLIPDGVSAGSADKASPGSYSPGDVYNNLWGDSGHHEQDVGPYKLALALDGGKPGKNVEKYLEVRPTEKRLEEYRKSKEKQQ